MRSFLMRYAVVNIFTMAKYSKLVKPLHWPPPVLSADTVVQPATSTPHTLCQCGQNSYRLTRSL